MHKLRSFTLFLITILFPFGTVSAGDFEGKNIGHIEYPAWFSKSPFFDLQEELHKAKTGGKQGLMVLFTTEGCTYCGAFIEKSLGDPAIASIVKSNFASIGLEIFDDAEMTDPLGTSISVKHFAKREGAGYSPTLVFYGVDGKRTLRAVGYQSPQRFTALIDYVIAGHYSNESVAEYFERRTKKQSSRQDSAGLKQDAFFSKPPYALDRSRFAAKRPLMVLFEETVCSECDDFHTAVLALPEVRDLLQKFEIVRLDARDDKTPVLAPDGRRVTPASWFKQISFSRLPALVFYDEKGSEVLKTDALVKRQRMLNSLGFVLERAYEKGWTYQRFARSKSFARNLQKKQAANR